MAEPAAEPVVYEGWHQVPDGLYTATQLSDLDMPRMAAGEPTAVVHTRHGYSGRRATFELYALADTVASHGTGPNLLANRVWQGERTAETKHTCTGCDARTERPCPVRSDHGGRRLCPTCNQLADLVAAQARATRRRHDAIRWAAALVTGPPVRYVHARAITSTTKRPRTVACHLTAADHDGAGLLDITVHAGQPRARGVPETAIAPEAAVLKLAAVLEGQRIVAWDTGQLLYLDGVLDLVPKLRVTACDPIRDHATSWRGDLDPHTHRHRTAIDPGRADRLWLLVARMAATPVPDVDMAAVDTRLRTDPYAAHLVLLTHHPDAAWRIESVLRGLGMCAGPTHMARGATSRRLPGATELHIPIQPDGLPTPDGP